MELSGEPIVSAALMASGGPVVTTPVPTAVNSPVPSQRNSALQADSPFWSNLSDLDYESEEVQRALDMAEMEAFGQVGSVAYQQQHAGLAEDTETSAETIGSEEVSTLDDSTSISESTLTGTTMTGPINYQVFGQAVPLADGQFPQMRNVQPGSHGIHAMPPGPEMAQYAGGHHHLRLAHPFATGASSLPADMHSHPAHGAMVVPTGFIVVQTPVTPTSRH